LPARKVGRERTVIDEKEGRRQGARRRGGGRIKMQDKNYA
jgi:hypothetical protein